MEPEEVVGEAVTRGFKEFDLVCDANPDRRLVEL
jgi:hypothetical protein